jgi:hypothetical protein
MSIIRSIVTRIGVVVGFFFDEPEVARYVTIAGTLGGVVIPDPEFPVSDRHFLHIDAPGLINGSIPIFMFRTKHAGRPTYSIRLNSTRLIVHTVADEDPHHTWHIFIPPGALRPQFNELVLNVSGDGSVVFSDVAILYKSNQLTVRRPVVLSPT